MDSRLTEYFAAKPSEELAGEVEAIVSKHSQMRNQQGLMRRWIKSYRFYYGQHFNAESLSSDGSILKLGEQGELAGLKVNHYRNFIRHLLIMATSQKISYDVRATNSDNKSLQQAKLGNNILDALLHEKRLGKYLRGAAELGLVKGKGFVYCTWDRSAGQAYSTEYVTDDDGQVMTDDEGKPLERVLYEGDIDVRSVGPMDAFFDPSLEDFTKAEWVIVRTFKNKYNLAAQHPKMADQILGSEHKDTVQDRFRALTMRNVDWTNDIPVYELHHLRTSAMPNGRYMLSVGKDAVLYDGPTPYDRLPIFRIVPGEIMGTAEGYSDAFDLISLQQAMNTLASTIFSNQQAFGVQNIIMPENANLSTTQVGKFLKVLKYNPMSGGKPEALNLTATPAEIFKFYELLERTMETISGVNSVARGNPDASLKSGVALGLVQSMAVQYASGFQQSFAELNEDVGSFALWLLKNFAKTKRKLEMAGKTNRGNIVEFSGEDLSSVSRVIVDLGNPLARTTAGKLQIADTLLDKGLIKTPQQYLQVLSTGNLEPLTEASDAQLSLIRQENEFLRDGKPVKAMVGDSHLLHAQEHLVIVSDPELRARAAAGDPAASKIIADATAHCTDHMNLSQTQLPFWSAVAGEPPTPQPPMGPPPGQEPPPPPPMEDPATMGPPMEGVPPEGMPMPPEAMPMGGMGV